LSSLIIMVSQKEKLIKEEEVRQAEVERFVKNESSVSGSRDDGKGLPPSHCPPPPPSPDSEVILYWLQPEQKMNLKHNFWIPENTPTAKEDVLEKPDSNTRCPFSGEKLKLKDLTAVKFTLLDPKQ